MRAFLAALQRTAIFLPPASPWAPPVGAAGEAAPGHMAVRMRYARFLASRAQRMVCSLNPMLAAWKQITGTSSVLTDIARGHVIIFKMASFLPTPESALLYPNLSVPNGRESWTRSWLPS